MYSGSFERLRDLPREAADRDYTSYVLIYQRSVDEPKSAMEFETMEQAQDGKRCWGGVIYIRHTSSFYVRQ